MASPVRATVDEAWFLEKLRERPGGEKLRSDYLAWLEQAGDPRVGYLGLINTTAPRINTYVAGPNSPGDVCDGIPSQYGFASAATPTSA